MPPKTPPMGTLPPTGRLSRLSVSAGFVVQSVDGQRDGVTGFARVGEVLTVSGAAWAADLEGC